jgi:hypothetical protein
VADILTTGNRSNWISQARVKILGTDDSTVIPDTTVTMFVDDIEREMKKRLAAQQITWSTLLGDDKEWMITATISMLAGELAHRMPALIPKEEKFGDFGQTNVTDWDAVAVELTGEVEGYLANITGYVPAVVSRVGTINQPSMWYALNGIPIV